MVRQIYIICAFIYVVEMQSRNATNGNVTTGSGYQNEPTHEGTYYTKLCTADVYNYFAMVYNNYEL